MAEPSFRNLHDRFFKELFARQENARVFLQRYLPSDRDFESAAVVAKIYLQDS
jgi:hypothetical protein